MKTIELLINGATHEVSIEADETLLQVLRNRLDLVAGAWRAAGRCLADAAARNPPAVARGRAARRGANRSK